MKLARLIKPIPLDALSDDSIFALRVDVEKGQDFEELVDSVKRHGIIEPIVVRPLQYRSEFKNAKYEIVCGHRRYAACRRLSLTNIPSIVVNLDDKQALEIALTENIHRASLNPIEEAEALKRYVVNFGRGSITNLSKRLGKSDEYISHRLLLLGLPKVIIESIRRRQIKASLAVELVWLGESEKQIELAKEITKNNLSFRETRSAVKKLKRGEIQSAQDAVNEIVAKRNAECENNSMFQSESSDPWQKYSRVEDSSATDLELLNHSILILRSCLYGIDMLVNKTDDSPVKELLETERRTIHSSLDLVISAKINKMKGQDIREKIPTVSSIMR